MGRPAPRATAGRKDRRAPRASRGRAGRRGRPARSVPPVPPGRRAIAGKSAASGEEDLRAKTVSDDLQRRPIFNLYCDLDLRCSMTYTVMYV